MSDKRETTRADDEAERTEPRVDERRPYVKPRIEELERLENVTLLSGGVNPTTANPFVQ